MPGDNKEDDFHMQVFKLEHIWYLGCILKSTHIWSIIGILQVPKI